MLDKAGQHELWVDKMLNVLGGARACDPKPKPKPEADSMIIAEAKALTSLKHNCCRPRTSWARSPMVTSLCCVAAGLGTQVARTQPRVRALAQRREPTSNSTCDQCRNRTCSCDNGAQCASCVGAVMLTVVGGRSSQRG